MPVIEFRKVEGLGNDFIVLDRRDASLAAIETELAELSELAPRVCHRHTGVGGDGILVLGPPRHSGNDASMWVVNHDGSRPEMCGNGLRCIALLAAGKGQHVVTIDTDSGPCRCEVNAEVAHFGQVEVDMGPGCSHGESHPSAAQGRTLDLVSMGNPHAIAITEPYEDPETLARSLGPLIERAREFPKGINVEFVLLQPDGGLRLWVWERGCGITDACGTGACATAVAVVRRGLAPADMPLTVHLPGGALEIVVPADRRSSVLMRGPARVVFEARLQLD